MDLQDISVLLPKIFGVLIIFVLLTVLLISMRLLAADARRRGKSAALVVLLAFVSFPLGLLLWLVFRPEPIEPDRREFQLHDHRLQ